MKQLYRLFFFSACLTFMSTHARAQQPADSVITGNFSNTTFKSFVQQVQENTAYRFYYDPATADSLQINTIADATPVRVLLAEIFRSTGFNFAIDNQQHIYVVYGIEIQGSLPLNFFARKKDEDNAYSKAMQDYLDEERKDNAKVKAENKLYDIGKKTNPVGTGSSTIAGYVRSAETGETVVGASVYIENPMIGVATDQFGYFALTIPKGRHELKIKSIGMKNTKRTVMLYADGKLDIDLNEDVTPLKEVVVESDRDRNVSGMQMGLEKLDIKTMKKVPVALGEVDILKVVLTLPGVQSVGEGTSGLNVRGGATNQNLILFNDAVIYNPTHLFGFFSAFNPDAIKNVELYKSGIPAEYGGRLSSVLDVNSREGNKKKFTGSGGIGPITGRLTLEGPIIKDKTSFMIGARSTYSDWLLKQIPNETIKKSKAGFYDVNVAISHQADDKNSFYLSGYFSKDDFTLNNDTLYNYQNTNASLKWKHSFNNKLYGVLTGAYSGYDYEVSSDRNPVEAYTLSYKINQNNIKADFSWFPIPKHSVNFGASTIQYTLTPGSYVKNSAESEVVNDVLQKEHGRESALYIGDQFDVSPQLSIYVGIRYSLYSFMGPYKEYIYGAGVPLDEDNIVDSVSHTSGKPIATYHGPEYRASIKYALSDNSSVKLSYNRTRQYIQMLSNTTAISPTDIWKLSDSYIKPQIGDQIAIGFYKNLRSNTIETSVEAYYKSMKNSLDYKGGADLIMNHHLETDIVRARGEAYGIEMMIKKMSGKVNGWISYTYSRSFLQTRSQFASENVNRGEFYPSNYDKPHAVNMIGNYKFSHRFSTSVNVTYSTGRPITVPLKKYQVDGTYRLFYSDRNQYRIPDYFRVDLSLNIEGNHKIKKLAHSSWTVGIYNLTGRKNAYSVFFESKDSVIKGYKLSIFGVPIPTVTYNFRF